MHPTRFISPHDGSVHSFWPTKAVYYLGHEVSEEHGHFFVPLHYLSEQVEACYQNYIHFRGGGALLPFLSLQGSSCAAR